MDNAQKEAGFTPGPWRFSDRSKVSGIASSDSEIPFAIEKALRASVIPIADIFNFPPATSVQTEIQRANARLIAAAPELLAACKAAIKAVDLALCGTPSKHYFADLKARLGAKGYTLEDNLTLNMQDIKNACTKAHAQIESAIAKATGKDGQ